MPDGSIVTARPAPASVGRPPRSTLHPLNNQFLHLRKAERLTSLKMDVHSDLDRGGKGETSVETVKVICLGDSAVGKSKLLERFLIDNFKPQTTSTYALMLYQYSTKIKDTNVLVDFWDTAGQEMFQSLHPSYYHQAQACIMVFDATRKVTYKNLDTWYKELRQHRPYIPVFCAANKIDANMEVTQRKFAFAEKNQIPIYYVSASNGTNVVKLFKDAIEAALSYKKDPPDVNDQIFQELQRL